MWPVMYEFKITLAVILSALAIKLVDDYLDQEIDRHGGRKNWAASLGNGSVVYAILLLCTAAALNTPMSMALFFSSYIVGMFNHWDSSFSSRLKGWQEMFIVLVLGLCLFGWDLMIFCLLFVFAVQLIDDYIDQYQDKLAGHRNFAHRLGSVECLLTAVLALLSAWLINENLFLPVIIGTAVFYIGMLKFQEARI